MNNAQLKLLIPLVLKQSHDTPNIEWDLLLEHLITCAYSRRASTRIEDLVPPELVDKVREDRAALHVTGIAKRRRHAENIADAVAGKSAGGLAHPLLGDDSGPQKKPPR